MDGLRGIAILLVVVWHYFYYVPSPDDHAVGLLSLLRARVNPFLSLGWTGVDLFFILSGFLIGGILLDAQGSQGYFRKFYLRRFFRIFPLYYGWILAYVVAITVAGSFLRTNIEGASGGNPQHQTIVQMLFLQNFGILHLTAIAGAWFAPTWSLAVEEQFYLFAPLVVRYLSRRTLYAMLIAVITAAPLVRLFFFYRLPRWNSDIPLAYSLTPCRADALAFGVLAALLWRDERFKNWLAAHERIFYGVVGALAMGTVALGKWYPSLTSIVQVSVGYTWIALCYTSILMLLLTKRSGPMAAFVRLSWLRGAGRVSYCVYLIHMAVSLVLLAVVHAAFAGPTGHVTGVQFLCANVVAGAVSFAIAKFSWSYVEDPILRMGALYTAEPGRFGWHTVTGVGTAGARAGAALPQTSPQTLVHAD